MAVVCLGVKLDGMNPARLKCLRDAFHVTIATELLGGEGADDVFRWMATEGSLSPGDRFIVVISYDDFGEVELVKLLEGLEERGWSDAVVCGFEKADRGEETMEHLAEYFMEGGPFELKPTERRLSVWPLTGTHATRN